MESFLSPLWKELFITCLSLTKKKFFTDYYLPVPPLTHRTDYLPDAILNLVSFSQQLMTRVANCRLCRTRLPIPRSTKGLPAQPLCAGSLGTWSRALGEQIFFSAELDVCTEEPGEHRGVVHTEITSWHIVVSTWSDSGLRNRDCRGPMEHSASMCSHGLGLCLLLPALPKPRWCGTVWVIPLLWI